MRIECPYCGPRNHEEFHYGGDATKKIPDIKSKNKKQWYDYIFKRNNPRGIHAELWYHIYGCRQWIIVKRNTLSHEILDTKTAAQNMKTYATNKITAAKSKHHKNDAAP